MARLPRVSRVTLRNIGLPRKRGLTGPFFSFRGLPFGAVPEQRFMGSATQHSHASGLCQDQIRRERFSCLAREGQLPSPEI